MKVSSSERAEDFFYTEISAKNRIDNCNQYVLYRERTCEAWTSE